MIRSLDNWLIRIPVMKSGILEFSLMMIAAAALANQDLPETESIVTQKSVRVASIQCYSRMGDISGNRDLLTQLIVFAATNGAKIAVTPECALTGYMDPANDIIWTTNSVPDQNEKWIGAFAETVPGPGTEHFGRLAGKYGMYICIGLAEKGTNAFFNSQVLLGPDGGILAHHRKRSLWPPGDGMWVTSGSLPLQVVDTEYGRMGLMICFDVHQLSSALSAAKADLVLYSVGWYGPNSDFWFGELFPRQHVVPNKFSIIVSNWSADEDSAGWPGHGYSCIINKAGKALSSAKTKKGSEVVFADLEIPVK